MKSFITILIGSSLLCFQACTKSDAFKGEIDIIPAPTFDVSTPENKKIKDMYDTYNVIFKPQFELLEYTYNWDKPVRQAEMNTVGLRFTPAKMSHVIPIVDSVKKWVFDIFPKEFSVKNMPLNILLVDSLMNNQTSGALILPRIYEGNIAINYIVLSYVSERFDAVKEERMLRESWLSLFVEKMLGKWNPPLEFAKVSAEGYGKFSFTNAEDVRKSYGILKKGRTKQSTGTATSAWTLTTVGQDFGDFVAFIVYTPDAEKATIYALNPMILQKVKLVKEYFKTNFSVELPYLPKAL